MASVDFNMHFEHVLVGCEVMGQGGTGYRPHGGGAISTRQMVMGFTRGVLTHIFSKLERLTGRLKPFERGNGKLSQCSCGFKADCLI